MNDPTGLISFGRRYFIDTTFRGTVAVVEAYDNMINRCQWGGSCRLIVDTDIDGPWVYGIELGEIEVAKYKRHALRELV